MSFALKDGVTHQGVCREIWYAIGVAAEVYQGIGVELVITSLTDGKHNCGSLHPDGKAADLRVKHMVPEDRLRAFHALDARLNPLGFDVCWEGAAGATPATNGAHIHIEFQPKAGEEFIRFVA